MKIKKLAALAMTCAMVVTGGALFAACGDDNNNNENGNTGFVEDTRTWFAVGKDSKGTLKDQGWDQNNSKYAFTKDTTVTNENVFTLSLDIYAGNVGTGLAFKFLYKETADEASVPWERQVGMQHLAGIEGSDADAVLKIDGKEVFKTAEDNGAYNNIALVKGQEGRYKFTLKTKSNTDKNPVITVEKESSITVNYDMYVIGDINDFGSKTKLELTENVVEGSATTWVGKLEITAADLYRNADGTVSENDDGDATGKYAAVCLLNDRDTKTFVPAAGDGVIVKEVKNFAGNKSYTCVLLKEGKYNVVFTEDTTDGNSGSVAITESAFEMYLIGTINGWNAETACTPEYALTEQSDGSWTTTITVTKDESIKTYNKKGLTDSDKYSAGADVALTAGTWAIKYDPDTNTFKAEKYEYYVVGTFDGTNFNIKKGVTPMLVAGDDANIVSCTLDVKSALKDFGWVAEQGPAGSLFAIQVVYGTELLGKDVQQWVGGGNTFITAEGEHTITFVIDTKTTTVTKKA